jgi:transcriptional regulator with XRE-family HTH domain
VDFENDRLGHFIKLRREALNLSQAELAKIIGLTQKSLSEIETGKRQPRRSTKIAIAKALNCSLADLGESPNEKVVQNISVNELTDIISKSTKMAIGQANFQKLNQEESKFLDLFKQIKDQSYRETLLAAMQAHVGKMVVKSNKKSV